MIDDDLRRHLTTNPDPSDLRRQAMASGMQTLRGDAWTKVQAGITTVEEVLRVLQS